MREEFEHKSINDKQKESIEECKNSASFLLEDIYKNCPSNRERSIAITKLEECVMWLSKSISHGKQYVEQAKTNVNKYRVVTEVIDENMSLSYNPVMILSRYVHPDHTSVICSLTVRYVVENSYASPELYNIIDNLEDIKDEHRREVL